MIRAMFVVGRQASKQKALGLPSLVFVVVGCLRF